MNEYAITFLLGMMFGALLGVILLSLVIVGDDRR